MKRRLGVTGAAIAALAFGAVSCDSGEAGSGPTCLEYDTKKVTSTVTPEPNRTYNRAKKRWENGPTPRPYTTTEKRQYCDEWATESASPSAGPSDS